MEEAGPAFGYHCQWLVVAKVGQVQHQEALLKKRGDEPGELGFLEEEVWLWCSGGDRSGRGF